MKHCTQRKKALRLAVLAVLMGSMLSACGPTKATPAGPKETPKNTTAAKATQSNESKPKVSLEESTKAFEKAQEFEEKSNALMAARQYMKVLEEDPNYPKAQERLKVVLPAARDIIYLRTVVEKDCEKIFKRDEAILKGDPNYPQKLKECQAKKNTK
ncbi:hypothetical protein ABB02_01072 [Clostridiaceae bacterium JG1575]|nr:hypothetical protein ABB02_01072 [Clostridiaceae bacterium JG1575]